MKGIGPTIWWPEIGPNIYGVLIHLVGLRIQGLLGRSTLQHVVGVAIGLTVITNGPHQGISTFFFSFENALFMEIWSCCTTLQWKNIYNENTIFSCIYQWNRVLVGLSGGEKIYTVKKMIPLYIVKKIVFLLYIFFTPT